MIEYPSIQNSNKSPRKHCLAFNKEDGSNIRVAWNPKKGFYQFGSRTMVIDKTHPHLGDSIQIFTDHFAEPLEKIFVDKKSGVKEIIVFGEYFGANSFAGLHKLDEPHKFVLFDILLGNKNREFLKPDKFIRLFADKVETPRVIFTGNLTDQFIEDVRSDKFGLSEGVVCKGTESDGSYRGKMWMCKIKTRAYLNKLMTKFGNEWDKYGE